MTFHPEGVALWKASPRQRMPRMRPIQPKRRKPAPKSRIFGRPAKSDSGRIVIRSHAPAVSRKTRRTRAEATTLLFDSNPVPMIVCALDGERILAVNDAAAEHYGYSRDEFEKLSIRSLQAFDSELPWAGDRSSDEQAARTFKHVRADGTLIDLAIYSR